MFGLDFETFGTDGSSIIVSAGLVYYDDTRPLTYAGLLADSIYVKFNVAEQKAAGRLIDKDTLTWWQKQSKEARRGIMPSATDLSMIDGLSALSTFYFSKPDAKKSIVFTRGGIDKVWLDSLCKSANVEQFMPYYNFRDVRTFLDCFYSSGGRGSAKVDLSKCPDFNMSNVVLHSPCADAAKDLCMILAGTE